MKLQTHVPILKESNSIDYTSTVLLIGSCFSTHIGNELGFHKFNVFQNPFGILFNPVASAKMFDFAVQKKRYTLDDVFFLNEQWHCFDAHTSLSMPTAEGLVGKLNKSLETLHQQLSKATHIFLTFGTSWVYRHKKTATVVANCHKVVASEFTKELLSTEEIVNSLAQLIKQVKALNSEVQFVFTISPIRHLKDGFIENQQSKASLITAVHQLISMYEAVSYFPAYEIMMDELRDYRFYEADMIHPNKIAISYVWERFKNCWINEETYSLLHEIARIQKGLQHRPVNPDTRQHRQFVKSLVEKITYLKKTYPFLDFDMPN